MVWDAPKLLDDGGGIPKSKGRRWRFDSLLWNLLSTWHKNLSDGQLPHVPFVYKKKEAVVNKGHFTHEPRAMTMKLWEPKRKCPKAIPSHLRNHVVWSRTLKCSVKLYVTGPPTKYYFSEFLFMQVLTRDNNRTIQWLWVFGVPRSIGFVLRPTSKRWILKINFDKVTM